MIDQLDEMLVQLLTTRLNETNPVPPIDVIVRPPDESWRAAVSANGRPAVNIYMVEVREDREQRSTRVNDRPQPEPFRVRCHYLISAWVPSNDPLVGTPTVVEDWLLAECIRILADEAPINASRIYEPNPVPADLEPILIDNDLRTDITPPEGYTNLADFWTGVGLGNVWHPTAHLIVTLPLVRTTRPVGPPVTTLHTTYWSGPERFIVVGGTVTDQGSRPVEGAWVRIEDTISNEPLQLATSDSLGQFTLSGLVAGSYLLRARSVGFNEASRPVSVPAPDGNYDLVLQ